MSARLGFFFFPGIVGHSQIDDRFDAQSLETGDASGIRLRSTKNFVANLSEIENAFLSRKSPRLNFNHAIRGQTKDSQTK